MLSIKENVDLEPFNTFHLHSRARYFAVIETIPGARELFCSSLFLNNPSLILGGGSNVLLTKDFDGVVVRNELKGKEIVFETETSILLKVGSGENWHEVVSYCVGRDLGGIENMALIPGTCGAAPIQNIGAYGVELKDVIHSVEAIDIKTGELRTFTNTECQFGYRESIFKHELKGKFFISSITLSLTKKNHNFKVSYGAIKEVISAQYNGVINIKNIFDTVISIRRSKLPDPMVIGNAGSFFKNPSIDQQHYERLRAEYPSIPSFPGENGGIKVPAGWLIEQNGWKGKTFGAIGVHKLQALVLVNYGGGEGGKIRELAMEIQKSVREKFGIELQPEVNII